MDTGPPVALKLTYPQPPASLVERSKALGLSKAKMVYGAGIEAAEIAGITRVDGLRYFNKYPFNLQSADIERYAEVAPALGPELDTFVYDLADDMVTYHRAEAVAKERIVVLGPPRPTLVTIAQNFLTRLPDYKVIYSSDVVNHILDQHFGVDVKDFGLQRPGFPLLTELINHMIEGWSHVDIWHEALDELVPDKGVLILSEGYEADTSWASRRGVTIFHVDWIVSIPRPPTAKVTMKLKGENTEAAFGVYLAELVLTARDLHFFDNYAPVKRGASRD